MAEQPGPENPDAAKSAAELDQERRTSMAAERTWPRGGARLWAPPQGRSPWAGSLPSSSTSPPGHTFCSAAATPLLRSASRSSAHAANVTLEQALRTVALSAPLKFRTVAVFTIGGVALTLLTVVLVLAQT